MEAGRMRTEVTSDLVFNTCHQKRRMTLWAIVSKKNHGKAFHGLSFLDKMNIILMTLLLIASSMTHSIVECSKVTQKKRVNVK